METPKQQDDQFEPKPQDNNNKGWMHINLEKLTHSGIMWRVLYLIPKNAKLRNKIIKLFANELLSKCFSGLVDSGIQFAYSKRIPKSLIY